MVKILIFLLLLFSCSVFAQDYEYSGSSSGSEGKVDFLASGGYSQIIISGNAYTGYNGSAKLMFPFSSSSGWSFGLGGKYEMATSNSGPLSDPAGSVTSTFNSIYAGLDLAYKLSFSFVDFQLNPYGYYGVSNYWSRDTSFNGTIITGEVPVTTNLLYGVGLSALFKLGFFYFGPSAFYSRGYLGADSYTDNFGNSYQLNTGNYEIYNYNFTIGMYL